MAVVAVAILAGFLSPRRVMGWRWAVELGVFMAVSFPLLNAWLRPLYKPFPPSPRLRLCAILAVLLPVLLFGPLIATGTDFGHATELWHQDAWVRSTLGCFFTAMAISTLLLSAFAAVAYRTLNRSRLGLFATLAASLTALTYLHIHCGLTEGAHLLIGHGGALWVACILWGISHLATRKLG